MKKCPYCAEDIQDAAVVCKHCQRDLTPAVDRSTLSGRELLATQPPKKTRWGWIALGVGLFLVVMYFRGDRVQFNKWKADREAWSQRCEQYIETPLTNPAAAACNAELNALMARAKEHGWVK